MPTVPGKRVTLQDVAHATGYTANTVSRALKNKPDISAETCRKIQETARKMGYVRNEMAGSLRSGQTKTLGVIVGGMSNPYYGRMTDDIQDAATEEGYSLLIFCSRDDPAQEYKLIETAISRQVDGILLFPCRGSQPSIDRLKAVGIPYVLMARYLKKGQDDCIICDEEKGAYLATKHLLEAGRHPAFLNSYDVVFSSEQRRAGFLRACHEAGLSPEQCPVAVCPDDESICRQLTEWKVQGVNGLFVFCDMEAWNARLLMKNLGWKVPGDFALVGFDNIQGTWHLPSPLCSVDYNTRDMVKSGMALLMKRIHGDHSDPQTILFEPRLVCRGSCGRLSQEEHF